MGNARAHINYLMQSKSDFELVSSNYTTGIKCEAWPGKYVANIQSNRTFACFSKLKKDTKDKPVPEVGRDDVYYFQHNFKKSVFIDDVINIDLKSAYATILFNDGIISKETFDYICKADKQERLASVGMLAARKETFIFKKGEPVSQKEVVSEKSGFFYYAVKRTFEIMDELKRMCGTDYLYTWVDGIYLLPNENAKFRCINYLSDHNYNYSVDYLKDFNVRVQQDNVNVTFEKEDKRKVFNLPLLRSDFKRVMTDAIMQFNYNHKIKKQLR